MFLKLFVIFCFILIGTEAWLGFAVYHNDAFPGKCYVNANLILSPGEEAKSPEGCSKIQCSDAAGTAQIVGCGSVAPPNNCEWDGYENVNAPFPLCCVEKYVCDSPVDEAEAQNLQNSLREMFKRQIHQ